MINLNNNTSELLLNTNPQFTTNLKIVVEDSNIYFNSIGIEDPLLQKVPYYKNTKLGSLLKKFWDGFISSSNKKFDNLLYKAGPRINNSSYSKKTHSYFSPLKISNDFNPDYFIIFKIDNFSYYDFQFEDLQTFYKDILYKSEIIKSFDLSKGLLNDILMNYKDSFTGIVYDNVNGSNITISGINLNSGLFNSIELPLPNKFDIEYNWQSAYLFEKYNMMSPVIINFEYLFDYEGNENNLIGFYFTREELGSIELDFTDYNVNNSINIQDIYKNSRNIYKSEDENGVLLNVKKFNTDLSELFEYNCNETGHDYGFYYNPYCPGELETLIPYGEETGYYNDLYLEWLSNYGYEIDFSINCNYNFDYLQNSNGEYFYGLEDRFSEIYSIKSLNENIRLTNKEIYLDGFFGIREDTALNIPGEVIYNFSYNSLRMNFKRNTINPVFNNGDWIEVKSGESNDNFIWRIFAHNSACCDGQKYCYYEAPTIHISSCDLLFTRQHNSILLDVKFDRYIKFEEGDEIILSCDQFRNIPFYIQNVKYNHSDKTSSITIIDFLGKYFKSCNTVRTMEFTYTGKSYYYTYFNPVGTFKELAKRLENAFNIFPNRLFEASEYNNTLVLELIGNGYLFDNFTFSYNFTNSLTNAGDIIVNDVPLTETPIFDSHLYELFKRKRGSNIPFIGGNLKNHGNRFFVNKEWAINRMNGSEIIQLSGGRKAPIKYKSNIFYSTYLEKPVKFENKILRYLDIDKYVTIEVDDPIIPIHINSGKMIQAYYEWKPKLNKFLILNVSEL